MNIATTTEDISGKVSHLYKQTPGWCAGIIVVRHREVKFCVKGYVRVGEPVTLRGQWKTHTKFGRQFDATEVVYTTPTDPAGVKVWLEWYVPDVGAVKAQQLVDEFGTGLLELASVDPNQIAIFARIPVECVHRIAKEWTEFASRVSVLSELAKFGLTQHQAELIYGRFKGSAITILKEDPYLLLREVAGFGFKTVDEIARRLGFPPTHPGRWRVAVVTAVVESYDAGSTVMEQDGAVGRACDLTEMPEAEYRTGFEAQAVDAAEKNLVKRLPSGVSWSLALPAPYRHEGLLWEKLKTARDDNPHTGEYDPGELAAYCATVTVGGNTVALDDTQRAAVETAAAHRVTFITGGAGAGKTLVAKAIHKMFRDAGVDVRLCAPTGKAARRLTEVIGKEATTIHRLLEYKPDGGFTYTDSYQLPSGVVLIDEISMVDSELAYHLFRACGNNTAIVCIGDPNQLPPVGAGALLRDVIDHDLAPVVKLSHCHRQAGPLKWNCNAILEGKVEPTVTDVDPSPWMVHSSLQTPERVTLAIIKLFEQYLPGWGYDPVMDTQFLTARHAGPLGTLHLNRVCQWLRQKQLGLELDEPKIGEECKTVLHPGDKVIHTRNNYTLNVMNGTQGVVITTEPTLIVDYDGREVQYPSEFKGEVQLSYVITPHKAQGSEWECAVVVCPRQHAFMQHRNWLYTATTRAKKTCVIVGDEDGIRRAAERVDTDKRTTCLGLFARHEESRP